MRYRLKNSQKRNLVDLTDYSTCIKAGVTKVFPNAVVQVHQRYFEIVTGVINPSKTDLQDMGKKIVLHCPQLAAIKTNYGYSTQLFEFFK